MRGAGVQSNRTVDCSSTPRGAQEVTCVAVLSNGNIVSGSSDRTLMMWDASSGECLKTLHGHTSSARRRRPAAPRVDCSSAPRRAQVLCVAALPNGNCYIVSGSWDRTLKVWDASSGECLQTLRGHTGVARRRRPVERRVDRSSTPRRAQVLCVAVLPNGRVVSGSDDNTLKVWDVSSGQCLQTLRGHTDRVRRRRPVKPHGRLLVDAARGAGLVRRRPVERPRRVRVIRRHAQGLGRLCEDGTSGCPAPFT